MTREDCNSLAAILSDLAVGREHESELLSRLTTLLNTPSSDMPAHLAKVCAQAIELFGEDAARFLTTPHWELRGERPILVAQTPDGAGRVEDLLGRITYGIPA
jgi:putative toxin-antitoxin system antitoxin component (TIGR02293 family)